MPTAHNGEVELYYETFGRSGDPTLLLVNGLGSQCINFAEEWCDKFVSAEPRPPVGGGGVGLEFVAHGYEVVRFDNRDRGLSSKLEGVRYTLSDMAGDAMAVLDDLGSDQAHVLGVSMGGMIVQRLAIDHPERLLSMTSVMSTTGESAYGRASREALDYVLSPPPSTREGFIEHQLEGLRLYGSKPEWRDDDYARTQAGAAYDRSFYPSGVGRQIGAMTSDGSRADGLRKVEVPTLVLHGSRDKLVDPSGGRRTAELIPNARYVEIEGMGHDYPPAVWDLWVDTWTDFVGSLQVHALRRK